MTRRKMKCCRKEITSRKANKINNNALSLGFRHSALCTCQTADVCESGILALSQSEITREGRDQVFCRRDERKWESEDRPSCKRVQNVSVSSRNLLLSADQIDFSQIRLVVPSDVRVTHDSYGGSDSIEVRGSEDKFSFLIFGNWTQIIRICSNWALEKSAAAKKWGFCKLNDEEILRSERSER